MPCFLIEVVNLVFWCILYRTPLVDIVLDELAYNKDNIPHFLKVTPEICISSLCLILFILPFPPSMRTIVHGAR